jgi:DNA primase
MSLSPSFLDELRSRLSMAQVAGRKLVWDQRKSNQAKGDWWAPCPFHQEKTASFHVDDRKGFYYCFGCHAKGDAISFVRDTENVGFMEAVEILAGEAGLPMPAHDPKAKEKSDRRTELTEVMEEAVKFFRLQLGTGPARSAREYLVRRGLGNATLDHFEVGFAPDAWQGIWDHLTGKGISEDQILATGLAKPSQKGGKPYDTFRNRIMYPIRDPRGRCIAFGGRAMDPADNAKYLNSPDTELFDKGRTLYNHAHAREAAGKGGALLVAEGYMDVIALSEAGFAATVAPLGTAITEDQLQLLWRISPEPVIALDGDRAGLRAAMRVIDIALPLIEAGKSLRFCQMPEGKDPDDVVRSNGADAMRSLLDAAQPMVSLLWRRETEGKVFDSPERKATLDKALREAIKKIGDPSIRSHYSEEIKGLRAGLFGYGLPYQSGRSGHRPYQFRKSRPVPSPTTKSSMLATQDAAENTVREAVILATLIRHPELIADFENRLEEQVFGRRDFKELRDRLLETRDLGEETEQTLREKGCGAALESLFAIRHVQIVPAVQSKVESDVARMTVRGEYEKLDTARGCAQEIAEATQDVTGFADESLTWRLAEAAEAKNRAERSVQEDKTEFDVADNGARISREERSSLDQLLGGITFSKGDRRRG